MRNIVAIERKMSSKIVKIDWKIPAGFPNQFHLNLDYHERLNPKIMTNHRRE